jgi:hypothetical protein
MSVQCEIVCENRGYFAFFSIFDEATLVHKVKSNQTYTLRGGLYSYNISV